MVYRLGLLPWASRRYVVVAPQVRPSLPETITMKTTPTWVVWGLCALTTVATARSVAAQAKEPYAGFDAYVNKAMKDWKIPGLSIAIVRHDSVVYAKGYGVVAA